MKYNPQDIMVSCIIPMYNSSDFIQETLESVVNQSYKNIEIILVDDDSTDTTKDVILSFIKKNNFNIQYFKNPGKGACAARNYGFKMSHGDFIQFLDADDILSFNKIKTQLTGLINEPLNTIASGVWGRFHENIIDVSWEHKKINRSYDQTEDWLLDSWRGNGVGANSIWLCPRGIVQKAGEWNETLTINQDGEYFSRIIFIAEKIKYFDDAKIYYRSGRTNSISSQGYLNREKATSLLKSYQLYRENSEKHNKIEHLKEGLANNFLMFMYQYYGRFDDLSSIAEMEFKSLGFKKPWPVGGARFKKIAKYIGFKNALNIKKTFKLL